MEPPSTDWQETGWKPFEALLPLGSSRLLALSLKAGELYASHSSTPVSDDADSSSFTWEPFSFDGPELAKPRQAHLCLILLPCVVSGRDGRRDFVDRAWEMLEPGDVLVIGSVNARSLESYRLFRHVRNLEPQTRAYVCLGRSSSEVPAPSLVSCRHDMQLHFYRRVEYPRTFLHKLASKCASWVGLHPWLSAEHLLVAEKKGARC